jgi:hypothetical protein
MRDIDLALVDPQEAVVTGSFRAMKLVANGESESWRNRDTLHGGV